MVQVRFPASHAVLHNIHNSGSEAPHRHQVHKQYTDISWEKKLKKSRFVIYFRKISLQNN